VARFLVATHPITGHVLPGIPIVTELVRRGHDVHWYVGAKFRSKAEQAGATFEPYVHALDYDDADYDSAFPQRKQLSGLRQVTYDFRKSSSSRWRGSTWTSRRSSSGSPPT
jgi:UDP:flavonoid glycosyltransferase YjiC (YdhE family)